MLNAEIIRPNLPKPNCKVKLVCGPPAAGKSTYVHTHATKDDIIIDLDLIAREQGHCDLDTLLCDRNRRLAALAYTSADRTAWVILCAPAPCLRQWWVNMLAAELYLLVPTKEELYRRTRDPVRRNAINKWFTRERNNDPGVIVRGCDTNGNPIDPLHPWNSGGRGADKNLQLDTRDRAAAQCISAEDPSFNST